MYLSITFIIIFFIIVIICIGILVYKSVQTNKRIHYLREQVEIKKALIDLYQSRLIITRDRIKELININEKQ